MSSCGGSGKAQVVVVVITFPVWWGFGALMLSGSPAACSIMVVINVFVVLGSNYLS